VENLIVTIDFNSDEAFYIQLCNQIIYGIANAEYREGDNLPSVRDLAEDIGINMHTVNKAYTILKQEGYVKLDRRKGAIIAVNVDKYKAMEELMIEMKVILAKAVCKNISCDEVHDLVDKIFRDFCSMDNK
jgi:GntR family transcriptional regulator